MPLEQPALPPSQGHAYMRDLLETSLIAAVIGAITGFIAIGVRIAIAFMTGLAFRQRAEVEFLTPMVNTLGPLVILVPAVGAGLGWIIVRTISKDDRIRGASEVVRSVAVQHGRVSRKRVVGHASATIVAVGSGGSAGREGAMVQLAAALGMMASILFGQSVRHRKILLAAGGAAAIGSTFNTPIAGVIFAHEVILVEWSTRTFVPLTVASAMGTLVTSSILGSELAFPIPPYELVAARELWLYIILGILAGLLAISVLRMLGGLDRVFGRIPGPVWLRPILGGLAVGVIGYMVPEVFGVGYETVRDALAGAFLPVTLLGILIAKVIAYAVTRGSGGASGAFSPSLFMGAALGGVYGAFVHSVFPAWTGGAGAYALVGMAAVYSAITRASLTAIIMLYEMTHTFSIIIPAMLAVVVADGLAKAYGGGPFYRLSRGQMRVAPETDASINILDVVYAAEIMAKPVETVRVDDPVRQVVEKRFRTGHQGYPVVDENDRLVGIVTATDMRRKVKEGDLDRPVGDFMTRDPITVSPDTTAHEALTEMVRYDIGHLPVTDARVQGQLVGFLTRTDLIGVERRVLEEEMPGEGVLTPDRIRPFLQMPERVAERGIERAGDVLRRRRRRGEDVGEPFSRKEE